MKRVFILTAVLAVCLFAAGAALAGEDQDPAAMMKAWQEAMTPGAPHQELASHAGNWTYATKIWENPAAPPMESQGKSVIQPIMGGRYVTEKAEGSMMGMPMEGMSLTGYNNVTKVYETVWVDNMGTGIMMARGTKDGNVITMLGETTDPMGQPVKVKMLTTFTDADHYLFEYFADNAGEMAKVMEIAYTRVGDGAASGD